MAIKMVGRVSTRTRAAAAGERHEERKKGRKKREKEKRRKEKSKGRKREEGGKERYRKCSPESTSCFSSRRVVPSAEDRLSWFTK